MELLKPEDWPRAPGFSYGVATEGRLVFVAGQIGRDPATKSFPDKSFGGQVTQAFANIAKVLATADARPEHIAHMTWYVTDIEAYRAAGQDIAAGYRQHIGKHFPSITMVQVAALMDAEAMVEIECVAVVPAAD